MIKRTIITLLSTLLVANPVMATTAVYVPSDAHKTSRVTVAFGTNLIANTFAARGNVGKGAKASVNSDSMRSYAVTGVTAGITAGVCNYLGVQTVAAQQVLTDRLKEAAIQNSVSVASRTTIGREDFKTALEAGIRSGVASAIGGWAAKEIGAAAKAGEINVATQYAAHAAVGAGMAAVTKGDIAAGAMGAVVGEFVAQQYREEMEAQGKFDPKSKDFADTVGLGINIAKLVR